MTTDDLPMKAITQSSQRLQRGAAAVEFAIVISLLVLIVGGIIEFGRVFWYYNALTKATRDGARFMSTAAPKATILTSSTAGIPAAQTLVVNAASAANVSPVLTPGNVLVTCQTAANATVGCDNASVEYVRVAITGYNFEFGSWFPMPLPAGPWALTPHTTMRYMCTADATTSC